MAAARARFGSKAGFILSGIGSAVGLGNIWRFPQVTSQNGGAAFVFVYIPLLLLIGIPLVWAELSIGQRGQGGAVESTERVAGKRWTWVGMLLIGTSTLFLSYYTVIAGLALKYVLFSPTSQVFSDPSTFLATSTQGPQALLMHLIFTGITLYVVSGGVDKGIERANLIMMPLLFAIVLGLAAWGLFQSGAAEGVEFYLSLDASQIDLNTIQVAIGQVFFSTSIGFGIMMTYGSYNDRGGSLLPSASIIGVSDMAVAMVAGLMIFPLAFSQGLGPQVTDPNAGFTTALFLTLPSAFGAIGGTLGHILLFGFFAMITMAALSSSISGLEVIVSWLEDRFEVARWKLALLGAQVTYGIGILSAMSVDFAGRMDSFVSNVMLIWGGILICLLYTFAIKDRTTTLLGEAENPSRNQVRIARVTGFLLAYVIPVVLIVLFFANLPETWDSIFG